jgi:hypothetical protein
LEGESIGPLIFVSISREKMENSGCDRPSRVTSFKCELEDA